MLGDLLGLGRPLVAAVGEFAGALGRSSTVGRFSLCSNLTGDLDGFLRLRGGCAFLVVARSPLDPPDLSGEELSGEMPVAFRKGVDAARPCVRLVERCCAPGFA